MGSLGGLYWTVNISEWLTVVSTMSRPSLSLSLSVTHPSLCICVCVTLSLSVSLSLFCKYIWFQNHIPRDVYYGQMSTHRFKADLMCVCLCGILLIAAAAAQMWQRDVQTQQGDLKRPLWPCGNPACAHTHTPASQSDIPFWQQVSSPATINQIQHTVDNFTLCFTRFYNPTCHHDDKNSDVIWHSFN